MEQIPLSRCILTDSSEEQTGTSQEQDETLTVADLLSFVRQCIPEVDVQLQVCRR